MSFDLRITNTETGLSKTVNADAYTMNDLIKTFSFYVEIGFDIKIIRGARC